MTRSEMRSVVKRLIHGRPDLADNDINIELNTAQLMLPRARVAVADRIVTLRFPELERSTETAITGGDHRILVGAATAVLSVDAVTAVNPATGKYRALRYLPIGTTLRQDIVDATLREGQAPRFWTPRGDGGSVYVYVAPEPTQDLAVRILWYIKPTQFASDSSVPDYDVAFHGLVPYIAARNMYMQYGEDERAREMGAIVQTRLLELATSDELRMAVAGPEIPLDLRYRNEQPPLL